MPRSRTLSAVLGLALTAGSFGMVTLTSAPAQAAGDHLVISEVYGAGGNSGAMYNADYVELYNPTAGEISLTGLYLQYRSSGGTGVANGVATLTGTVPAGSYFLVATGPTTDPDGLPLPSAPDLEVTGVSMAASAGTIYLASTATALNLPRPFTGHAQVVDLVGFGGTNTFEGAGPTAAISTTTAASRNATADDTNVNSADFTVGTPAPQNCDCAAATPLNAAEPNDVTTTVGQPMSPITLGASGGTAPYSWTITGLPAGLSETSDGVIGGTPTEAGVSTVSATVTDAATPAATDSVDFVITVQPPAELVTIAAVQGTPDDQGPDAASPMVGRRVKVQGVVTGRYPAGSGNLWGFFLQTPGEEGVDYDTPGASDAIFVYNGGKPLPALGASVEVTGTVEERFESTQVAAGAATDTITVLESPLPAAVPGDTLPGTDCALPGTDCLTGAALEAEREEHEGEAFLPVGRFTVTDSYDGTPFTQASSRGFQMQGEIGLAANSAEPLMIPTELIDQSDAAAIAARRAYNTAHAVVLDDGADRDYTSNAYEDQGFPWLAPDNPVRVGAAVEFKRPVILEYRRDLWRVQPETRVEPGTTGSDRVTFDNTRTNAPEDVLGDSGDLKIATFNMLNYFNTYGETWAASDGNDTGGDTTGYNFANPRRCSFYRDRGTPGGATSTEVRLTNDTCEQDAVDPLTGLNVKLPGPRGAANDVSFQRQEAKELEAINTIDADVMSLEEVENSIKLYDAAIDGADGADRDRDDALKRLVEQLNIHWEATHPGVTDRWAFVASPRPEALPTVAEQDAIRSAFIYNPSKVEPVGRSQVLVNSAAFRNAREPLAQAFKPLGGGRADAFGVIVNHFKSKGGPQAPAPAATGDNVDSGDGAGFYNGDRKRQAAALVAFADQFAADKDIEPMFLSGDFNSYSAEDPVQIIEAGGFTNLRPDNGETTYSFGGLAGSLDHVFANEAAEAMVTGEDVWAINAGESVYYEYSRYNASATDLYSVNPFRSSDHNPEIIGIDVGENIPDPVVDTVQVLATNDFHGRLLDDPGSAAAGAASMAGAVKQLRAENDSTVFAAAGDLVGASTFESFIQDDEPTIDALNEAGLEVSAVGNHEFDRGYVDLVDRIIPRATWEYIGANVEFAHTEDGHQAGDPALPETWCQPLPNGRVVGFVGAVTEDLPALVAGSGIEEIVVTDVVEAVNEQADALKGPEGCGPDEGPADLVVELVHEGAATTSYDSVTDDSTFGQIVAGANENVDAIVSGHTHLAYNHKVPVPAWALEGRAVTKRPVVSAGQYGANLNRLQFEFAPGGGELVNIRQTVLQLKDYDADPDTQAIVDAAADFAEEAGSQVLGEVEDEFMRARRVGDDGQIVENRGGESTLGNLIAEMQRWQTGADIGFMNPGGLRADLQGLAGTPRDVTYRQAANTQPFANTLVTMKLRGSQIKTILEQQWQRDADGNIPSRPFLRLGTSDGFTSTFDPTREEGSRITGMYLDGEPVALDETYVVSATSFLAGSGDNFTGFAVGSDQQDTGLTDLQAVVNYLAENAAEGNPLPVDYGQHQVGIDFANDAPATYEAGDALAFGVSSLAMTGGGDTPDVKDTSVSVYLGETRVGDPFPVTNTLANVLDDSLGTASVSVTVPEGVGDGVTEFLVKGDQTGTEVLVPVRTDDGKLDSAVTGSSEPHAYDAPGAVEVSVDPAAATGTVTLRNGETSLGSVTLADGRGTITIPARSLAVGSHTLSLSYSGDETTEASTGSVQVSVTKSTPALVTSASPETVDLGSGMSTVTVSVSGNGYVPTGSVQCVSPAGTTTGNLGADGEATCVVGPFSSAGPQTIDVTYSGDDFTAPASDSTTVVVEKLTPTMAVASSPHEVVVDRTRVKVVATVMADDQPVAGAVRVQRPGYDVIRELEDGRAQFRLPKFDRPGDHSLTATYLGNDQFKQVSREIVITVGRARR